MKSILTLTLLLFSAAAMADLQEFTTDGCSAFPDHPLIHPNNPHATTWAHCCLAHDFVYWHGGPKSERRKADTELARCAAESTGEITLGHTMVAGVYFGGAPRYAFVINSPLPWRWGYGWTENYGYSKLTPAQQREVEAKLVEMYDHLTEYAEQLGLFPRQMEYVQRALYSQIVKFQTRHNVSR